MGSLINKFSNFNDTKHPKTGKKKKKKKMEEGGGRGRRSSSREMMKSRSSPERGKVGVGGGGGGVSSVKQRRPAVVVIKPAFRKVQVVYYLSRNGLLEHPHYMEVTHLAHQPLRLKDVMDRLTVLRGKGMPSLYSWSCKRSYKNGYVWNDLAENDIIYPSEGAEYVLKGSELIQGCTENLEKLQVSNLSQEVADPSFHQKRKPVAIKRHREPAEVDVNSSRYEEEDGDDDENQEYGEYEDKTRYTCSMTPPQHGSFCSRGVSTDETLQDLTYKNSNSTTAELTLDDSSPPSATSSTISEKANDNNNNISKRYEDGDPASFDSSLSHKSVLLQLISCGGSASFRAMKTVPVVRQQPPCTAARKSTTGSSLHKGVLCKTAAAAAEEEEEEEDADMISCMSENPRFGNLQAEEKEYFSGSIVEERIRQVEPIGLKRSNSYTEERCSKAELVEAVEYEPKREKAAVKTKCIPRLKSTSSKQTKK